MAIPIIRSTGLHSHTLGHTVALPVARILPVVASALGTGIDPHWLPSWDHLCLGRVCVTIWAFFALWTALPFLVDRVDTRRGGAICHQAAGDAVHVTGALLALRGLELFSELKDLSPVLAAYFLAPRAAVGWVVADMDTSWGQRGAFGSSAGRSFDSALTLGTVIRVQKVPLAYIIDTAIGLTGVHLPRHGKTGGALQAQR